MNDDCLVCGGSGFVKLPDRDGPGTWPEERNCDCQDALCECEYCAWERDLAVRGRMVTTRRRAEFVREMVGSVGR